MSDWFFIALAIACWSLWAIAQKMAVKTMPPAMVQLTATYVYSAAVPVIFLAMKAKGQALVWAPKGIFWASLAPAAALTASLSFLIAASHRPLQQVLSITQLYPLLTYVLCWVFLGESFTGLRLVGAAMMVGGCIVMNQ